MVLARMTITGIMTCTAIAAFDLACLTGRIRILSPFTLIQVLPMANVLVVASLMLRKRWEQGPRSTVFLVGFVFTGWITLMFYILACERVPDAMASYVELIHGPLRSHQDDLVLMVVAPLGPQLIPALVMGCWNQQAGKGTSR